MWSRLCPGTLTSRSSERTETHRDRETKLHRKEHRSYISAPAACCLLTFTQVHAHLHDCADIKTHKLRHTVTHTDPQRPRTPTHSKCLLSFFRNTPVKLSCVLPFVCYFFHAWSNGLRVQARLEGALCAVIVSNGAVFPKLSPSYHVH